MQRSISEASQRPVLNVKLRSVSENALRRPNYLLANNLKGIIVYNKY